MWFNRFFCMIIYCFISYGVSFAVDEYFIDLTIEGDNGSDIFNFLKKNKLNYEVNQITLLPSDKSNSRVMDIIRIKVLGREKIYSIYEKLRSNISFKMYKISSPQKVKLSYV